MNNNVIVSKKPRPFMTVQQVEEGNISVQEFCARHGIESTAIYLGEHTDDYGWQHDAWQVTLRRPDNHQMVIKYHTGLGHRTKKYNDWAGKWQFTAYPPSTEDVVGTIISNARDFQDNLGLSFEEWADMFGYDTDSRKAERTYNACRDEALRFLSFIGAQAQAELETVEPL